MSRLSLGWITQLVARYGVTDKTILSDNDLFIQKIKGKFDTLWFDDHFHKNDSAILETWTTLTYWAAQYPEFRFGTSVLCQSYRNPALLAKMAATFQLLTGGRLILGIGAGWKKDEYEAFNYPFPPIRTRIEQLDDTARILKSMWTESPATVEGKHYKVTNAMSKPLPATPPALLIGGGGEKYTLRVVAKHADWMNVTHVTPEEYKHKLDILESHCEEVDRDFQEITKSIWIYIFLTKEGRNHDPSKEGRYVLSGTPDQVLEGLKKFIRHGAQHLMLRFIDFPESSGLDLFLEEVYPYL